MATPPLHWRPCRAGPVDARLDGQGKATSSQTLKPPEAVSGAGDLPEPAPRQPLTPSDNPVWGPPGPHVT